MPQHVAPELLNKVTKALGITALDQWYYVSHHAIARAIGARTLFKFGGITGFLKHAYPSHKFDEEKLKAKGNVEKDQKFLEVIIRQLFPNTEIQTKARKAVGVINPETESYLEIDFWIPSLKLGIEYQDKHHYAYQWYANEALEDYQKRDNIKKVTMSELGYTLITIGYWWDKTRESIVATIRKFRPDLLREHRNISSDPIPSDPPPGFITDARVIPGISGLMSPFVPSYNFNPTNWFAGEKYDGIRGVFNPTLKKMFSRWGKELSVLAVLLADIPGMLLDGEITAGRGNYSKTAAVSNQAHHDKVNWPEFRYFVFDIPDAELGDYTHRYNTLLNGFSVRSYIFAQTLFRVLIGSNADLKMLVDAIISDSGEGVIVQKNSSYEYGRAKGLAKIKVRRDADAQVLFVNKRSCTCKLPNGVTAEINLLDDFDPSQLKPGDIISYFHKGHTQSGKPILGEIYKVRYDVSWEQLKSDATQGSVKRAVKETIGSKSLRSIKIARNKKGHWNKPPNVKAFFDEFALTNGFDPLLADNWYPITIRSLRNAGATGLFHAHRYSLKKALSCAYPELKFKGEKFRTKDTTRAKNRKGHWKKPQNVQAFFDEFARTNGFDPQDDESWYPVRYSSLKKAGGSALLKSFSYNLQKALLFAYPRLKFDKDSFVIGGRNKIGHWNNPTNVRAFFDSLALTTGFDPRVAENWYPVTTGTVQKAGGSGMLNVYSLLEALTQSYPELKFNASEFRGRQKATVRKA